MTDFPPAAVRAAAQYLRDDEVDRAGEPVQPLDEFFGDARELLKPIAPLLMAEGMLAFAAYLDAHPFPAPVPSSVYARLARERAEWVEENDGQEDDDCFTATELAALDLAARLAEQLGRVVGDGPTRAHDLNELLVHVHGIQHALMAQAAARLYPERFRLMGGVIDA